MASQANQALPAGSRLENYRIVRTLASGGFSFLYPPPPRSAPPGGLKEKSPATPRGVIKEYLPATLAVPPGPSASPTIAPADVGRFNYGLKCFFEEGRALAGLQHPNVVRVLNFFRANDTVYLVMRYEHGRSLETHIRHRRGLPEEVWLRSTFAQLLNGLREVHSNKLLHLDIKPANVYLRDDDSPILLDFGAARQTLSAEGGKLPPTYTPGYAAPEQYAR